MLHVNRSLTPACYDFSLPRFRILLESRKASGSRNTFKRLGASHPVRDDIRSVELFAIVNFASEACDTAVDEHADVVFGSI